MPTAVRVPVLPSGSGNGARAFVRSRVGPQLSAPFGGPMPCLPDREFAFGFWILWHFFQDLVMPQISFSQIANPESRHLEIP